MVKRGHGKALAGDGLRRLAAEVFRSSSVESGKVIVSFGALRKLTTWTDGKDLFVDTEMDGSVDATTASETIRRYNEFLGRATGYTAKQRARRAQDRVKGVG